MSRVSRSSQQNPESHETSPQNGQQSNGGSQSQDKTKQQQLDLLFDRPGEPVFFCKGNENTVFNIPDEYIAERFRESHKYEVSMRSVPKIPVRKITLPDLRPVLKLGRRENFSLFIPEHSKLAGKLIDILMGMSSYEEFYSAALYCRDHVNPYLYIYALSVTILHRPDTKNCQPPPLYECLPDLFMDGDVIKRARETCHVYKHESARKLVEIPRNYTASDIDPEHKVAYFREDLGINLHHWHWHLVYPYEGNLSIVNKDRRGELFYYMHQQIIARFNFERLCNKLAPVERMTSFREPIEFGYFPKLDTSISSRTWPSRHDGVVLRDINRQKDKLKFDLSDLERWRDRIFDAIDQGAYIDEDGSFKKLDDVSGIDILGNLVESSIISKNRSYYGSLHNYSHDAIALCHDPDGRHLEPFSIMGQPATAMRDPVFYRLHAYMDHIFQRHKNTLSPYTEEVLDYPDIEITNIEIIPKSGIKNKLNTFWEQSDLNLSRGIDFIPKGNVSARVTYLQHQNFEYQITVKNSTDQEKMGTVRIFLAPKFDEGGLPWLFVDQKNFFIELDKFIVTLKPGENAIKRNATNSSVTIPFEATFRNLESGNPQGDQKTQAFNFCSCGWPQHMLIPKGSPEGFRCVLFVMISDIDGDKVEQQGGCNQKVCFETPSYCGLRDKKYPDRRNMGFPFDRLPRDNVQTLEEFLTPNMRTTDVQIVFEDKVKLR